MDGAPTEAKSVLHLRNDVNDAKDKLAWKWSGESTTMPELADPTVSADYAFCVYDQNGAIAEVTVPAAGTCGDKPCWSAKRTRFAFKDRAGANAGIQAMSVKASAVGKSAAAVKGKGLNLPDATLGSFALPVTAQLVNLDTDLCLNAGFDSATVTKNSALEFKAKAR